MSIVLVINSGSSSFKYQLLDVESETVLASGLVERIGEAIGATAHTTYFTAESGEAAPTITRQTAEIEQEIIDHAAGFAAMLAAFELHGPSLAELPPVAVGHRVVHGGSRYVSPTVITPEVEWGIGELATLAPLHNPGALAGIVAAREAFGDIPHVAVFDTAFHQTLKPEAYTYAIDLALAEEHGVRRYGFHGTSHQFVSRTAAQFVGGELSELRQIVFHLGNGASACAIEGGKSIDTSMGFTPLEGLVMGTRSGDIDPAVLLHLHRVHGMSVDDLDVLLNKNSGLFGLSGYADMRDVLMGRAEGAPRETLAFDVYVHRLRAYLGDYLTQLGGVDVISFTAGVGENAAPVRKAALANMEWAGIRIDDDRNESTERGTRVISSDDSAVTVLVVPTNEEREIAMQTLTKVHG